MKKALEYRECFILNASERNSLKASCRKLIDLQNAERIASIEILEALRENANKIDILFSEVGGESQLFQIIKSL